MSGGEASSELAEYEILELAGEGGSGLVSRARRRSAAEIVALKVARDAGGSPPLAREAGYAALALSPRLPELVDVGWARVAGSSARAVDPATAPDAVPFVALRWAPGAPLAASADAAAEARVDVALRAARDVGDALADLHEMGVAHGGLKDIGVGWVLEFRDPDGTALELFAPKP